MRLSVVLIVLVLLGIAAAFQGVRAHRLSTISALPTWSADAPPDPSLRQGEGYVAMRSLIVPDRLGESQQWIAQTQTALQTGNWRLSRVDYDNAPDGRTTNRPVAYRFYLGVLASLHARLTDGRSAAAVEKVALYADVLLQGACVLLSGLFVARLFGLLSGAFVALGWATLYPLSCVFVAGQPHPQGLVEACFFWSLAPLAAGVLGAAKNNAGTARVLFTLAGCAGGFGLWLETATFVLLIAAVVAAGLIALAIEFKSNGASLPWRRWSMTGCATALLGTFVGHYPDRLLTSGSISLVALALAWLAMGDWLQRIYSRSSKARTSRAASFEITTSSALTIVLVGLALYVSIDYLQVASSTLEMQRLTRLSVDAEVSSLWSWFRRDGISLKLVATVLPGLFALAGGMYLLRQKTRGGVNTAALTIIVVPAAVFFILACIRLRWWSSFDVALLVILAVVARNASEVGSGRMPATLMPWGWIAGAVPSVLLGVALLIPPKTALREGEFAPEEMHALMERDLAQWIARRNSGAIVLAPSSISTALWFHGGVRTLTSFDPENEEGFFGALRIAGAPSAAEAHALVQRRGVTHLVLPSWDTSLDESARQATDTTKSIFWQQLREWRIPAWLSPVAHYMPKVDGFEGRSLVVFEVGEEVSDVTLLGKLATYFIEAAMLDHASQLRQFTDRFPTQPAALISRAEIEYALGDQTQFAEAMRKLDLAISGGGDRTLPWERRFALATVLTRAGHPDEARVQLSRCLNEANDEKVRALSPRSLYRLLALAKNLRVTFSDPALRKNALTLLPPDARAGVE